MSNPSLPRRLDFLDGIRGLAALYVLLFHVIVGGRADGVPGLGYSFLFVFGHEAVVVFIVVSGFSLMLAPLRSPDKSTGGTLRFLRRRAWRILPPYYAALFMWPLFLTMERILKYLAKGVIEFGDVFEMLGNGKLLSHLVLLHNLRPEWNEAINPVMWSIATEFQIYILFVLILLPVWKHLGVVLAIVIAFAIGLAPLLFLPKAFNLEWASPQFVGIFALGMTAAMISLSTEGRARDLREKSPWGLVALVCGAVFVFFNLFLPDLRFRQQWLTDTIIGMITAAGIIACCIKLTKTSPRRNLDVGKFVIGFFNSKPVKRLGQFSYSLYLVQIPVLLIVLVTLRLVGTPPAILQSQSFAILVLIPVVVASSYVFYLAVEQWFLPGRWGRAEVARGTELVTSPGTGSSEG